MAIYQALCDTCSDRIFSRQLRGNTVSHHQYLLYNLYLVAVDADSGGFRVQNGLMENT